MELDEQTRELRLVKARFETALRGAKIFVFSQNRELRYTWVYSPHGEDSAAELVGKTDADISAAPDQELVVAIKRQVLETGIPADAEVSYQMPEGRLLFSLHIDPTFGVDGAINGITCAAIDITRIRSLESEQRRLTEELSSALHRYETALRGSNITVFTHDRRLRYTSITSPLFGLDVAAIVGRTDADLLSESDQAPILAIKQKTLTTGVAQRDEICIRNGAETIWYQLHVEPYRDLSGAIDGLTCAAVDITARKDNESHLRFLMRELTHRSKNLLAVVQAMARQTARSTSSTEAFVEQFGSRLQALSRSHDLLVEESWHGASLDELVRSQLDLHFDRNRVEIDVGGPHVMLKPESAQTLGLALHELATNAVSVAGGAESYAKISVRWAETNLDGRSGIQIEWRESAPARAHDREQRGFGALAFERSLVRSLEAEVDIVATSDGVQCRIFVPWTQFAEHAELVEPGHLANV